MNYMYHSVHVFLNNEIIVLLLHKLL